MMRLAIPIALVLLAAALFGAWMHPAVLDPTNVGWLLEGRDRGQSAIGLAAYLRAGHWPSLHEPLLAAPEGLTLLFTDSIPLLGLLLGPFARVLPGELQFIGLWYAVSILLQVVFAWLLIRPRASDEATAFLGTALLALMPALLNRFEHASLCAQWLILFALWIFVDEGRARRPSWWALVLGLAALVHSYLLLMVAAFWVSAILREFVRCPQRRLHLIAGAVAVAAVPVLIVAWYGLFGQHYQSTGSYGAFPMALDAFWNPANPAYTALLPSSANDEGRGFEGLQYLGAGLLLAVVVAIVVAIRRGVGSEVGRLAWLLPAFVVILVVAIGPQMLWRGEALVTVHLPRTLTDTLDPVRAGGRLAWPVTYTIAYAAIVLLLREARALLLLGLCVTVQIVDLAPMLAAIRHKSALADETATYRRTLDPRWAALVGDASAIQFEPADPFRDLQLMEEISWRAVAACRPLRVTYASRVTQAMQDRIARDSEAFNAGRVDPTRLYVLLGNQVMPPIGLADRIRWIDAVAVIPPSRRAGATMCSSSSPRSAS